MSMWFSVRGHASAPKQLKQLLIDIKLSQKFVGQFRFSVTEACNKLPLRKDI